MATLPHAKDEHKGQEEDTSLLFQCLLYMGSWRGEKYISKGPAFFRTEQVSVVLDIALRLLNTI